MKHPWDKLTIALLMAAAYLGMLVLGIVIGRRQAAPPIPIGWHELRLKGTPGILDSVYFLVRPGAYDHETLGVYDNRPPPATRRLP